MDEWVVGKWVRETTEAKGYYSTRGSGSQGEEGSGAGGGCGGYRRQVRRREGRRGDAGR